MNRRGWLHFAVVAGGGALVALGAWLWQDHRAFSDPRCDTVAWGGVLLGASAMLAVGSRLTGLPAPAVVRRVEWIVAVVYLALVAWLGYAFATTDWSAVDAHHMWMVVPWPPGADICRRIHRPGPDVSGAPVGGRPGVARRAVRVSAGPPIRGADPTVPRGRVRPGRSCHVVPSDRILERVRRHIGRLPRVRHCGWRITITRIVRVVYRADLCPHRAVRAGAGDTSARRASGSGVIARLTATPSLRQASAAGAECDRSCAQGYHAMQS